SLGARIMAVADSFDAMTSRRHYRKVFSKTEAVTELRKNSGTQFDPQIVEVFIAVLEKNPALFTPIQEMSHEQEFTAHDH
ncbi:MAG: hypothetical protein NC924_03045, partial [Candidatus Omnitrophica bacterium]|nr:hypothetical protein [Candidatus Omnitrophota bacterium]